MHKLTLQTRPESKWKRQKAENQRKAQNHETNKMKVTKETVVQSTTTLLGGCYSWL